MKMNTIMPNSPEFAHLPIDTQRYILRERAADRSMRDRRTALYAKEEEAKNLAEFLVTLDDVDITQDDVDNWDLQAIVDWVEAWGYAWNGSEWELDE